MYSTTKCFFLYFSPDFFYNPFICHLTKIDLWCKVCSKHIFKAYRSLFNYLATFSKALLTYCMLCECINATKSEEKLFYDRSSRHFIKHNDLLITFGYLLTCSQVSNENTYMQLSCKRSNEIATLCNALQVLQPFKSLLTLNLKRCLAHSLY